jgi:ABC-type nitrate/sulfonate/bicarbonate transport system substrate-binding protein
MGSNDFFVATQKDIDFAWIFQGWTGIEAQIRGTALDYVALKDWTKAVPDYYTPTLIASEQTIKDRPELVKKFMAATSKGYQFAIDNPAEAAAILIKHNPEGNPELIKKSQAFLSPLYAEGAKQWGEQKLEIWKGYGDWMAEQGLLPKKIDAEKAFTNAFLPK